MKTILRVLFLNAIVVLAPNVHAGDNGRKSVNPLEWAVFPLKDGRLRINVRNNIRKGLMVVIKSVEGEILQQNYIRKGLVKAAINYDISELNEGDYKICIYSDHIAENKIFHVENIAEKRYRVLTMK